MARLYDYYKETVAPELSKKFGYKNVHQVPKIEKIVLNMGVGEAINDSKQLDSALSDLMAIAGQRPVKTKSKKSVAGFKLREGQNIGAKVTIRNLRMYEFLDRLVNIALPRVKDFRGLSGKGFDGNGNYSFGIKEQLIFPEVEYQNVDHIRGLNVVIVTSAGTNEEALALLKAFNLPIAA